MTKNTLIKLIKYLQDQGNIIYSPQKFQGEFKIAELEDPKSFKIINELPQWGWKQFAYPAKQELFQYKNKDLNELSYKIKPQVFLGVSIIDLKALTYLNFIFENDAYYQAIKKKTLVIGHNLAPSPGYKKFFGPFKEHMLEHVEFDIFLIVSKSKYQIYTGSEDGQRLLDDFGYKDYQNIAYVGHIKEEGLEQRALALKDAMLNKHNPKVWQDLDKRCLECGKCSLVCPLCYCFMIDDFPGPVKGEGTRKRTWDSCFYSEFSQVAGPAPDADKHKFLNKTGSKIHNWYNHKFVRWVAQYSVMGCVFCGRCSKACPADISLPEEIQKIQGKSSEVVK